MGTSAFFVSSEFHPSETASLFHQSSPFALCLAFGAGICVSAQRGEHHKGVFSSSFSFRHASRHARIFILQFFRQGMNPGPLQ